MHLPTGMIEGGRTAFQLPLLIVTVSICNSEHRCLLLCLCRGWLAGLLISCAVWLESSALVIWFRHRKGPYSYDVCSTDGGRGWLRKQTIALISRPSGTRGKNSDHFADVIYFFSNRSERAIFKAGSKFCTRSRSVA